MGIRSAGDFADQVLSSERVAAMPPFVVMGDARCQILNFARTLPVLG